MKLMNLTTRAILLILFLGLGYQTSMAQEESDDDKPVRIKIEVEGDKDDDDDEDKTIIINIPGGIDLDGDDDDDDDHDHDHDGHDHDHDGHDHDHDHDGHDHDWDDDDDDDDDEDDEEELENTKGGIGWDLGLNFLGSNGSFSLPEGVNQLDNDPGKSWQFALHIPRYRVNLSNHQINLITGLDIEWNGYNFSNKIGLAKEADTTMVHVIDNPISGELVKNRLRTTYLTVPLMINIRANPKSKKSFYVSAGGFAGIRLNAKYKTKIKDDSKTVVDDRFHTNKFKYGLRGEIGIGNVSLYSQYTLSTLFDEDAQGIYEINPVTFGLSFGMD